MASPDTCSHERAPLLQPCVVTRLCSWGRTVATLGTTHVTREVISGAQRNLAPADPPTAPAQYNQRAPGCCHRLLGGLVWRGRKGVQFLLGLIPSQMPCTPPRTHGHTRVRGSVLTPAGRFVTQQNPPLMFHFPPQFRALDTPPVCRHLNSRSSTGRPRPRPPAFHPGTRVALLEKGPPLTGPQQDAASTLHKLECTPQTQHTPYEQGGIGHSQQDLSPPQSGSLPQTHWFSGPPPGPRVPRWDLLDKALTLCTLPRKSCHFRQIH